MVQRIHIAMVKCGNTSEAVGLWLELFFADQENGESMNAL